MSSGRLKALLHVAPPSTCNTQQPMLRAQQPDATRNATRNKGCDLLRSTPQENDPAQHPATADFPYEQGTPDPELLRVASPRARNTQHAPDRAAELRRLVEAIARCAPRYWKQQDVEEAVEIGSRDMDAAIKTFAAILAEYRDAGLRP